MSGKRQAKLTDIQKKIEFLLIDNDLSKTDVANYYGHSIQNVLAHYSRQNYEYFNAAVEGLNTESAVGSKFFDVDDFLVNVLEPINSTNPVTWEDLIQHLELSSKIVYAHHLFTLIDKIIESDYQKAARLFAFLTQIMDLFGDYKSGYPLLDILESRRLEHLHALRQFLQEGQRSLRRKPFDPDDDPSYMGQLHRSSLQLLEKLKSLQV